MAEQERSGAVRGGRIARTAPLVGLAGRTAGEAVVASLRNRGKSGDSVRARAAVHARAAERYADRLGRSKGVLMKAGQILSFVTLGPLVGGEYRTMYQAALARLQDDAPPMTPEESAGVIEAEFGAAPSELFAEFEPAPMAAASIGQVHAARLHDGRRVAVKVQYPGIEAAIRADLANTELLATYFQLLRGLVPHLSRIDARGLADEVSARIGEEIDYRTEAANQSEFAVAYRGHPFIRVPEVVTELSSRRVLTMDLVEGLHWPDAVQAGQAVKDQWGEAIYRFSLGSLRRVRLYNADPHPGNYLFHPDGCVTFLDFGCVKRYTTRQIACVQAILRATVDQDADALLRAFRDAGFVDAGHAPDQGRMLGWYTESLKPLVAPQPFTYTPEYAASVVESGYSPAGPFSDVVRKLSMDPDYLFLTRIDLGMTAVLGALGATGPWKAIRDEWDAAGPPATPYGELDAAFWASNRAR